MDWAALQSCIYTQQILWRVLTTYNGSIFFFTFLFLFWYCYIITLNIIHWNVSYSTLCIYEMQLIQLQLNYSGINIKLQEWCKSLCTPLTCRASAKFSRSTFSPKIISNLSMASPRLCFSFRFLDLSSWISVILLDICGPHS